MLFRSVGLLNVGSEELKGHEELRQAAGWLRREGSPIKFHGFVEGNDITSGVVDGVVVKSHGGISAEGFAYAVDVGYEMVHCDLLTKINQMLNRPLTAATTQEPVS